jgi:thiol:disulfide interchange protein
MGREDAVKWLTPENAPAPAQSPKPVLYEFSADWCPPCQKLRQQVFCDGKAAAEIQNLYTPVQVLDRRQEEGKNPPKTEELQKQYAIQAFPTLVVAYPDGRPPKTASGYENKESVMAFLEDAARMDGNTPAPATGAQTKQRTGK